MSLPLSNGPEHALKCELAEEVLRSSGHLRLQVTGWSMLPTVFPEDTLVIKSAAAAEVSEGDIVLFRRDCRLFAHRVLARPGHDQLVTRGDAMPYTDSPIGKQELLGRVVYMIRNGRCIEPGKSLSLSQRALAALVRSSETAARVFVGIRGMAAQV
jgi:hypothetical protein